MKPMLLAAIVAAASLASLHPAFGEDPNLRMTNDVRVYQMTKDAVVNISSTRLVSERFSSGNPFFDQMGGGIVRDVPAQSLGSGFVIHPDGYIVTNEHVVDEATDVQVVFSNGEKLEATVLATDNEHDIAVLKVTPKKPLQAITLGASDDLMIGEPVYAIGNPFGYAGTMTRGIVSALNRTLDVDATKSYKGLIQTDASINPGNSGGPLLNAYGEVIGINTAIRADAHGIGFAISVSNMRDLLPAFLNPDVVHHSHLGFVVEEKREIRPPAQILSHVIVHSVEPGSAAAHAGLHENDVIEAVNNVPADSIVDTLVVLANIKPGDPLTLTIAPRSANASPLALAIPVTKSEPPLVDVILLAKMGVEAKTITPSLVRKLHLAFPRGVLITGVKEKSVADQAGLESGDILVHLDRSSVNTAEQLATALKNINDPTDIRIAIIRGNSLGRGIMHLNPPQEHP